MVVCQRCGKQIKVGEVLGVALWLQEKGYDKELQRAGIYKPGEISYCMGCATAIASNTCRTGVPQNA